MKPTKNKFFCVDIGRTKLLFESQEKAERFIKFNSEDIFEKSGKAPVRCYFCSACGGWHITSSPHQLQEKTKSEIAIELMKETNRNINKYQDKIKDARAKIKIIIDELPKKYEQTKDGYLKAVNHEEKIKIIDNFINYTKEIRRTMALTRSQRKEIHILETSVRSLK